MQRPLLIIGGAIAGLLLLGTGGLLAADQWLDQRAKTTLETKLTQATGVTAAVDTADVQLLRRKVTVNHLQLANLQGFPSSHLLTIDQVALDNPAWQNQPFRVAKATVVGVKINVDGDFSSMPQNLTLDGLPQFNLLQLMEHLQHQATTTTMTKTSAALERNSPQALAFTIDELVIDGISIQINLQVPWQEQAIAHAVTLPEIILTEVNNLNMGQKLGESLGQPVMADLQAFLYTEVLPSALEYMQKSLPTEIDLSTLPIPEGVTLPENLPLPNIKLPQGNPEPSPN